MSTKSVDFRPLPTPEQVRAHGEGGLWEASDEGGHKVHYKFWDRDRTTPWYDCSSIDGSGFCHDRQPWKPSARCTPAPIRFRPLNPDGTPRDWAEIDAAVTAARLCAMASAESEPDYRAPTDAELRAHVANGGMWQRGGDNFCYEILVDTKDQLKGGSGWDLTDPIFADYRKHLRPVDRQGKPMPWPKVAQSTAEAPDPVVTPPPDGKFQVGDVVKLQQFSGEEKFSGGNPGWNQRMAEHLTKTVAVEFVGRYIRAAGWNWPIERVSFVSRPSKAQPEQKPTVAAPAAAPASEFRKLTREIVEANPGQLWERQGGYSSCYKLTWRAGRFMWDQEPFIRDTDWHVWVGEFDAKWRPLKSDHQPMAWSELKAAAAAASVPQPIPYLTIKDDEPLTFTVAGPVSSTGRLVSHADSLGASAVLQIEDAMRRAIAERVQAMQEVGQVSRFSIDTLAASDLDIAAEQWYSLSRQPNETDEQLRQRCRDAKAKENPMPTIPGVTMATLSTPAIPNFAAMSPEDRARYRAALDAADPPTFRDALRSGLEHAPVELALDKLHTFVSRLADLWTEGNEEERATVRRFLRDLLSSDYGKAAIGLGAGAAIPHAAPLAAKLLPDDKDAGPLLRRVGFILVERGTATGAKRLGLDIWDAAGPMLDELRQMLRDLVKGMKQADTVVGFLPPASPKLDFASGVGVVEAETVTQKR